MLAGRVAIAESRRRIGHAEARKKETEEGKPGEKCNGDEDAECGKKNSERRSRATRSGAERSGARKAVARGRKARGGKGRRPRGRRRLTDRRRSRGERARLRGIPGRARAVPPEARRFQSFARDDEPRTSRVRETRSRFTVRPTDPHRVYRASVQ